VTTWAVPEFPRKAVDQAGAVLASTPDGAIDEAALGVISNWRASHRFPLNTLQIGLRRLATNADPSSLISQRLKRLSSISSKLQRFPTMNLSQMQDIGGARAVVRSTSAVREVLDGYNRSSQRHALVRSDNYIESPKPSGYRGVHLIYRYFSDRNDIYNGLKVELQIRTGLQHAWATAVEIVGTFISQSLKSSQGEAEWLRFFALMGTAIATREKAPAVPDTPRSATGLRKELRHLARQLSVQDYLRTYGRALRTLDQPRRGDKYFLLQLNTSAKTVSVRGYKSSAFDKATSDYLLAEERSISNAHLTDAVLVSVDSLDNLRRAYPNYFLDTTLFINAMERALSL
jgi:hypothetical protein